MILLLPSYCDVGAAVAAVCKETVAPGGGSGCDSHYVRTKSENSVFCRVEK